MSVKRMKPPIVLWHPKEEEKIITYDGKIFICNFDKVLSPELVPYKNFMINKSSYEKQLDQIVSYINFFLNFYDKEHELILGYLKLKFVIDRERLFSVDPTLDNDTKNKIIDGFISLMHNILFEDTSIAKNISKLVEDNYIDDIESSNSKGEKKEYLESLEFTNAHVKLILKVSFAMKIIAPVMFHYFYINGIKLEKGSDYIYRFYKPLFGDTFETNGINLFNKLFVYVKSRVFESSKINAAIFDKREIMGTDTYTVLSMFIKKVVISDNMVKYSFPETWDEKNHKYKENIVGFNKTILKLQLNYFIKEVHGKNLTEVSNTKNTEGLSGADKMEMNIRKMDEGMGLFAELNAEQTVDYIKKVIDIPVTKYEVDYMIDHFKPNDLQIKLIYSFYSNYFGNYRDTALITGRNFYTLALLLKKKLLLDFAHDITKDNYQLTLPYVLTGNVEGRLNSRVIRNNKYLSKLESDDYYQKLLNNEYKLLLEINPDEIKNIISTMLNLQFSYVTPENPDLLGEIIETDENKLGGELLYFLYHMERS
nr:MAG TPA: hypothetical protein [Caudoviricetes sp.]